MQETIAGSTTSCAILEPFSELCPDAQSRPLFIAVSAQEKERYRLLVNSRYTTSVWDLGIPTLHPTPQ